MENNILRGTMVLATFGYNNVTKKPFKKLYEFGYYTKTGCVVYTKNGYSMQDAAFFKLDQIKPATIEDLDTYWRA